MGKPDFPKYVILGIAPFLCSKEVHSFMHSCKALHANIRCLDGHWGGVVERINLHPGRLHRPYDFLARRTKNNPVRMCFCNREPVNTGAELSTAELKVLCLHVLERGGRDEIAQSEASVLHAHLDWHPEQVLERAGHEGL